LYTRGTRRLSCYDQRMGKAAFDAKIAAIDSLKSAGEGSARDTALAKAIGDRNNFISAKGARVAGEVQARAVVPDLLAAFGRFMTNPVKSDPKCWAKTAIIKSLAVLGHQDPEVYVQGLGHIQPEPVWGGQEDTAGSLRANSIIGLMDCRGLSDISVLEYLAEPLFDADKNVRAEAARAIGRIDRRESGVILRVRALAGDSEPEPLGAIYFALLGIEGRGGIPFIARFLKSGGDAAQEAALALGGTHEPAAFEVLKCALREFLEPSQRSTLMVAVALTRLPEAIDFLIEQVQAGSREADEALREIPLSDAQRARLDEVRLHR
jgi:HEAT repeat protein